MRKQLKIDFHVHTGEDPKDRGIRYSAKQLLDHAAAYHFDAIAIANHYVVLYTQELQEYAAERGILLIPGVEATIEGKHVVIINCQKPSWEELTFQNVRAYAGENALIIAPHPFFPRKHCLHEKLEEHIDVFDAIRHLSKLNPNASDLKKKRTNDDQKGDEHGNIIQHTADSPGQPPRSRSSDRFSVYHARCL